MSLPSTPPQPPLRDPARLRPLGDDLGRLWRRRHFLVYSAFSELRAREMDTLLGNLWHLVNPALQILVYYVVFGLMLGTDRGVDNFLPFLAIGVFSFQFMRRVIVGSARSLVDNRGLITSVAFPRALLPLSVAVSEAIAFLFPALMMLTVAIITGETPTIRWLLLIPIFMLQALFTIGAGFISARITFYFRDFENLLDFLLRMAFYFSGVLFLVDRFVPDPTARAIVDANPFLGFISLYRWSLMDLPVTRTLVVSTFLWGLVGVAVGYLWFRRREPEYGRE
jgi:teichoic acid transport system permease protein